MLLNENIICLVYGLYPPNPTICVLVFYIYVTFVNFVTFGHNLHVHDSTYFEGQWVIAA